MDPILMKLHNITLESVLCDYGIIKNRPLQPKMQQFVLSTKIEYQLSTKWGMVKDLSRSSARSIISGVTKL